MYSQHFATLRKWRQGASWVKRKTVIIKLLHHGNLAQGKAETSYWRLPTSQKHIFVHASTHLALVIHHSFPLYTLAFMCKAHSTHEHTYYLKSGVKICSFRASYLNAYYHRYTNRAGNECTLTKLELHYADFVVQSFTHTQVMNRLLLSFQCPLKRVMRS